MSYRMPLVLFLLAGLLGAVETDDPDLRRMTTPRTDARPQWQELHARHLEQARAGGIRILFIGDSLTHFWEAEGKAVWQAQMLPRGAAQFGIPGDHCASLLGRLPAELAALKNAPEQVVLLFGSNNVIAPPERTRGHSIAGAVQHIVAGLRRDLPTARLTVVSVLPRRDPKPHVAANTRTVNAALAAGAASGGYRYLDIHDAFATADGQGDERWFKDEVHLNAAGYARYAERLLPVLDEATPSASAAR